MLTTVIVVAVIAAAAYWFRDAWTTAAKDILGDNLAPIIHPSRKLKPAKLVDTISNAAIKQIPKVAANRVAHPRTFTIHVSDHDYNTVDANIELFQEEVTFRIIKFAEAFGKTNKEWWPEVGFLSSPQVTDGWPVVKVSYNPVDAARAQSPTSDIPSADDTLRRALRNRYSIKQPAVDEIIVEGLAPTEPEPPRHQTVVEGTGSTIYSGQMTEYLDHDSLGPLYQNLPTTLVPLDPRNPKIALEVSTVISRELVGGSMDVSRRHCTIEPCKSGWMLTDKGSTNGTSVNGATVRGTKPLFDGDKIQFGSEGPIYLFDRSRPGPGVPKP